MSIITIETDDNDPIETLQEVARWMGEGMTSGFYPTWSIDDPNQEPAAGFAPAGEEDKYRDLWESNMPRVSGCVWLAIPGEQPIHLEDNMARRIMVELSKGAPS